VSFRDERSLSWYYVKQKQKSTFTFQSTKNCADIGLFLWMSDTNICDFPSKSGNSGCTSARLYRRTTLFDKSYHVISLSYSILMSKPVEPVLSLDRKINIFWNLSDSLRLSHDFVLQEQRTSWPFRNYILLLFLLRKHLVSPEMHRWWRPSAQSLPLWTKTMWQTNEQRDRKSSFSAFLRIIIFSLVLNQFMAMFCRLVLDGTD